MEWKIPFCLINLDDQEKKAIAEVIDSGWVAMGDRTRQFEKEFASYIGAEYAVFVDSCTSALFLALQYRKQQNKNLIQIEVPSFTFVSTVEVVVNCGLEPVFVDVDKDTFCLPYYVSQNFNDNLDASIGVHLTGNRCYSQSFIYDSAHRIEQDDVGYSTAIWCYSFYATKNLTTIDGGMIATNDKQADKWFRMARDHGVTQGTNERYKNGNWKYDIKMIGWRKKSNDLHATIGLVQLKKLPLMQEKRNSIVKAYNSHFERWHSGNHIYPIKVKNRKVFLKIMENKGIQCAVHFLPVHKMTAYKQFYDGQPLPNTDYLGEHVVSLPLYPSLTDDQVRYIIDSVKSSNQLIIE